MEPVAVASRGFGGGLGGEGGEYGLGGANGLGGGSDGVSHEDEPQSKVQIDGIKLTNLAWMTSLLQPDIALFPMF